MAGLGELPPDQQGKSDRQFPGDPAIGSIIGRVRSGGPFAAFSSKIGCKRSPRGTMQ